MNYWWTSDYGSASAVDCTQDEALSVVEWASAFDRLRPSLTTGHFSPSAVSAFKKEEKKGEGKIDAESLDPHLRLPLQI